MKYVCSPTSYLFKMAAIGFAISFAIMPHYAFSAETLSVAGTATVASKAAPTTTTTGAKISSTATTTATTPYTKAPTDPTPSYAEKISEADEDTPDYKPAGSIATEKSTAAKAPKGSASAKTFASDENEDSSDKPSLASEASGGTTALNSNMDSSPSFDIKQNILSDDEIAEKCKSSIAKKTDMVTYKDADGNPKRAPRCVQVYEAMRETAQSYSNRQAQAVEEVKSKVTTCDSQQSCVAAGTSLVETAKTSHEELGQIAKEGANKISAIVNSSQQQVNSSAVNTDTSTEPGFATDQNG